METVKKSRIYNFKHALIFVPSRGDGALGPPHPAQLRACLLLQKLRELLRHPLQFLFSVFESLFSTQELDSLFLKIDLSLRNLLVENGPRLIESLNRAQYRMFAHTKTKKATARRSRDAISEKDSSG